jgi:hypothetical protein
MTKIHTTIGLRVSFFFVCDIAVHSVSTSPGHFAFVDYEGLNERKTTTEGTARHGAFKTMSYNEMDLSVLLHRSKKLSVTRHT